MQKYGRLPWILCCHVVLSRTIINTALTLKTYNPLNNRAFQKSHWQNTMIVLIYKSCKAYENILFIHSFIHSFNVKTSKIFLCLVRKVFLLVMTYIAIKLCQGPRQRKTDVHHLFEQTNWRLLFRDFRTNLWELLNNFSRTKIFETYF